MCNNDATEGTAMNTENSPEQQPGGSGYGPFEADEARDRSETEDGDYDFFSQALLETLPEGTRFYVDTDGTRVIEFPPEQDEIKPQSDDHGSGPQ